MFVGLRQHFLTVKIGWDHTTVDSRAVLSHTANKTEGNSGQHPPVLTIYLLTKGGQEFLPVLSMNLYNKRLLIT